MKKLMIALGAAASMAWCANAVESQVVSAINFDSLTVGATLDKNMEETTGEFVDQVFWASGATELSSTIKERSSGNNYLAVDETEVLERKMKPTGSTSLADNGVYFTADVQFTASDESSGAGMVTTGDKLLVWLRATEAVEADPDNNIEAVSATTNLIITAAATDAGTTATDYIVDSSVVIDPTQWYTLTIKAVQGGTEGYEAAAFTVELDGNQLSATAAGASEAKTTFNSLVAYTEGAATTITSVGFKGTGALDNLEFGTFTEVAQKCTVSISVTDEEGKMLGIIVDQTDVPESLPYEKEYTIASGAKSTIVITVDDGYVVTYNNTTYTPVEGDCTIEIDLSAAKPNDTVNVDLAVVKAGSEPTTWPEAWTEGYSDTYASKLSDWAKTYNVTDVSALPKSAEDAFLLNVATNAETTLSVTSIIIEGGMVKITTSPASTGVNGKVYLYKGNSPTSLTKQQDAIEGGNLTTIPYDPNEGEQFYKVEVGY